MDIEKIVPEAVIPTCGTKRSAGLDLTAISYVNKGNNVMKFGTGIKIAIPESYFGGVYIRSGLGSKGFWSLANGVGIIDSDYRGEIFVMLRYQFPTYPFDLEPVADKLIGTKVAQLIIQPFLHESLFVSKLNETERGENGFGSTDKKS